MRPSISDLSGSITALVTPFRAGLVDEAALIMLVERQIAAGTSGLVVCGSTGEAATLSPAEQAAAIALVASVARGRLPVIAGCTSIGTADAAALAHAAAMAGANAVLVAAPPYVKATQEGVFAHVRAVAHAADLPVMLYDVPSRTGTAIADDTIARLHEAGLITALKDATGDLSRPPRLRGMCGAGLRQFTGEDASAVAHRAMGGVGCVSVTANVAPALCMALHRAWDRGDFPAVEQLRDALDPLHRALFAETNPIAVKAALFHLGLCADEMRLPLTRATETTAAYLRAVWTTLAAREARAIPRHRLAVAV